MADPLLEAVGLRRVYPRRRGAAEVVAAVDGVDLGLAAGDSLGVVGESGAGKSTLARLLLALERPDAGVVRFDGHPISAMSEHQVRPLRRRFQPVFQDPLASLNPRLRVGTIVSEPLVAFRIGSPDERRARVADLLRAVGLDEDAARRFPGAFSGGERQRIAIARAIASDPELLVLDEPVSSLDVAVQARILDLIGALRARRTLAIVLIAHDLDLVRRLCPRVAVLYRGRVVEQGATDDVLGRPTHPYTAELLAASPRIKLADRR
jgi:ABC-type microcin C transport system duplicated ATPase subunit YejF